MKSWLHLIPLVKNGTLGPSDFTLWEWRQIWTSIRREKLKTKRGK